MGVYKVVCKYFIVNIFHETLALHERVSKTGAFDLSYVNVTTILTIVKNPILYTQTVQCTYILKSNNYIKKKK
jgi:hypothetical protein